MRNKTILTQSAWYHAMSREIFPDVLTYRLPLNLIFPTATQLDTPPDSLDIRGLSHFSAMNFNAKKSYTPRQLSSSITIRVNSAYRRKQIYDEVRHSRRVSSKVREDGVYLRRKKSPIFGTIELESKVRIIIMENVQQETIEPSTVGNIDKYMLYDALPRWGWDIRTSAFATVANSIPWWG